ncbi:hypothetical protein F5Y18DRAFT_389745 [Xylariaceae sp. FL1019]|nr:hypothetical protein F5Y18DRAFT_389745 [Xylariaceae sp. FL1019]
MLANRSLTLNHGKISLAILEVIMWCSDLGFAWPWAFRTAKTKMVSFRDTPGSWNGKASVTPASRKLEIHAAAFMLL